TISPPPISLAPLVALRRGAGGLGVSIARMAIALAAVHDFHAAVWKWCLVAGWSYFCHRPRNSNSCWDRRNSADPLSLPGLGHQVRTDFRDIFGRPRCFLLLGISQFSLLARFAGIRFSTGRPEHDAAKAVSLQNGIRRLGYNLFPE